MTVDFEDKFREWKTEKKQVWKNVRSKL